MLSKASGATNDPRTVTPPTILELTSTKIYNSLNNDGSFYRNADKAKCKKPILGLDDDVLRTKQGTPISRARP
jgi:hypothetical protein